ncbi:MAG: hypothetical protein KA149_00210 [Chitinophagales bacterium]|nr:hypothetical protein [Chitinophagales bacterium]
MIANVKNLYNQLITIGVTDSVPQSEIRYIRFTNLEAIQTVIGAFCYVVYSIVVGLYMLSILQGIVTIGALFVLYLNFKNHHKPARLLFLLSINLVILANASVIGTHSGVHEFFYITYIIPFLLFNVRDYKHIIAGVLMAVIGFNCYQYVAPYFTAYNLDIATQENIFRINNWVIFGLFGLAVYMLAYFNFKTETALAETHAKLAEQAQELKRSNEDLEQFSYIISHDLKAPVRNISSFMSLLQKQLGDSANPMQKEFVEMSKQSADRLTKQIDDLLSYCRVDRSLPPAADVDLNQMVRTIQMELHQKITEKNATIIVEGTLPVLHQMHSSMMHHVFQNLIANGIKFNTTEKPEVRISCKENHGIYTFSFTDNGIGIAAAYKNKLFQMFKRLHTSEQFEGTGIGLAVCKKIINFYKGEIWFEGEPGKGTTFFFTLSVNEAPEIPEKSEIPAAAYNNTVLRAA